MATRKNNWLNAKPVTKAGGKSGGARNPAKPYNKPASTSGTPKVKTKTQKLQQAAKTKPSSPAPKQVIKKPVTRTGPVKGPVPPKGYSAGAAGMPNSAKARANLPKTGARAERTATRANQLIKDARAKAASAPKPSPASGAASTATKAAGRFGKLAGAAGKALGAVGAVGAMASEVKAMSDRNKTFSWNRPKPKPITKGNAQSRFAGARDANLKRINSDPRFAAPKEKPKPPAPTQSGGGSTQSRSGGGGSSRPAAPAPRRQPGPAADAGMKNQDKNYKGKYLQQFKEETGRMSAANLSRQQGRSNLTSSDLKPKPEKTLREKMDELKKKRNNTAFGGA